jgi:hypothetical protein
MSNWTLPTSVAKATRELSGDHAGASLTASSDVSRRSPVPPGCTSQSSRIDVPAGFRTNTIQRPFGDQAGCVSLAPPVRRGWAPVPSAFTR